ncbi:MAG: OsmC family protein [Alphaproteobacteria bacterium]|nr:OsmC family protein [Alphaproteobacteria bacterium]
MAENDPEVRTVDIVFEAEARTLDKLKSEVTITSKYSNFEVTLQTDEGKLHGGDASAPMPLHYFAAGVVTCLMTQMKASAKRLRVPLEGVRMGASFHWRIEQSGRDPYSSVPVGFDIDIEVDSEAPLEDVKNLIEWAKKGCFAEQALALPCPVGHRLKVGEDWVAV